MEVYATKSSPRTLLSVISITSFRNLWVSQVLSQLAINMMLFLFAIKIYETTKSNTFVSLLFLCYGVPSVIVGMVAGALVDHLDKRNVLVVSNLSRALLVTGLVVTAHSLIAVYAIAFVHAVITQFYVPSEAPLIPKIVPKAFVVSANSLFSMTYYSSMAVGFVAAGPLLRLLGPVGSLLCIAGLFFAATRIVLRVQVKGESGKSIHVLLQHNVVYLATRVFAAITEALTTIAKTRQLVEAIFLLSATQVVLSLLGSLGPGFADTLLNIDVRDASVVVLGPVIAGILIGALWVGANSNRYSKQMLIRFGILGAGTCLLCTALVVGTPFSASANRVLTAKGVIALSFALFFAFGFFASLVDVPANSILQTESFQNMRGRVYGILTTTVGGFGMFPVVAGGILADAVGIGRVILFVGLAIMGYGVVKFLR